MIQVKTESTQTHSVRALGVTADPSELRHCYALQDGEQSESVRKWSSKDKDVFGRWLIRWWL